MNHKLNKDNFKFIDSVCGSIKDGFLNLSYNKFILYESSLFGSGSYDIVLIGDVNITAYGYAVFVCLINGALYYLTIISSNISVYNSSNNFCNITEIDCDDLSYITSLIGGL